VQGVAATLLLLLLRMLPGRFWGWGVGCKCGVIVAFIGLHEKLPAVPNDPKGILCGHHLVAERLPGSVAAAGWLAGCMVGCRSQSINSYVSTAHSSLKAMS
jgi:hypothetical protein